MEQTHIQKLRAQMERRGYRADADGIYHIDAPLMAFDHDLWEALVDGPEPPFQRVERLIPELIAVWRASLADRLRDAVRRDDSGAGEAAEAFVDGFTRLPETREAWLDSPVRVDIGLTVDDWSEYTANVTYPAYMGEEYDADYKGQFGHSSIMWLTRRQGYSQAQLREALYSVKRDAKEADIDDPSSWSYLFSAAMEVWHELSIFNQLGFFVRLPLRELLLLDAMQRWGGRNKKWPGYILLDRKTTCGFFTTSEGSCSLLRIQLEKDVKVPLDVAEIYPDGGIGYGIHEVGEPLKGWQPDCVRHWGLPRQFRRDAAQLGVERLPPRGKRSGD